MAVLAAERRAFGDLAGFPLDDAWIHLVLARSLAAGDGIAFPGGEPVAASTSPLWTALLALCASPLAAKLLGVALHLAGLVLTAGVARRLGIPAGGVALAVVAFGWSDRLVFAAVSGMEVSLFVALTLAGFARHLAERERRELPPLAFLLFGLAALARPEGLLLPLLAAFDRRVAPAATGERAGELPGERTGKRTERVRRALTGLALAAVVVVPVALVYLAISGSPLPTTLAAKSSGPPALVPELRHLRIVLAILFESQPALTLLAAGGALALAARLGGARDRGLLLPLWTIAMPVASAMLSSGEEFLAGNFGRYFFPLLPCVVLLGVVALEPAAARIAGLRSPAAARAALAAGLVALLGYPLLHTARAVPLYLQARGNVEQTDLAATRWLGENAAPGARLAVVDIGIAGWHLPNPLLDLGGIVSPGRRAAVADARARGESWAVGLGRWIEAERPDLVVVFPRWFPLLEREPARFPPLARFRIRDNVAMAGDELVVYATPWTRPGVVRAPPRPAAP